MDKWGQLGLERAVSRPGPQKALDTWPRGLSPFIQWALGSYCIFLFFFKKLYGGATYIS